MSFVEHVEAVVNYLNNDIAPQLDDQKSICFVAVDLSDKWIRIERRYTVRGRNGSAYAFIAKKDYETKTLGKVICGGIYKPANYAAAAKHVRGSIFDPTTWTCFGLYSVSYLRGVA